MPHRPEQAPATDDALSSIFALQDSKVATKLWSTSALILCYQAVFCVPSNIIARIPPLGTAKIAGQSALTEGLSSSL